jgi:hypothetical protein
MADQCKECRFCDGSNCSSSHGVRDPNFTCANWVAYR